jgi:hypothetical protein
VETGHEGRTEANNCHKQGRLKIAALGEGSDGYGNDDDDKNFGEHDGSEARHQRPTDAPPPVQQKCGNRAWRHSPKTSKPPEKSPCGAAIPRACPQFLVERRANSGFGSTLDQCRTFAFCRQNYDC